MSPVIDLKREQRTVAFGAAPALAISLATFFLFAPVARSASVDAAALLVAAKASLVPALCVVAAVGNVASRRYFSAADIGAATQAGESRSMAIARALLANTVEQAFLAVVLYFALALLVSNSGALVAACAILFGIGRLLFAAGYRRGAGARAFGFGLTFYPNAIGLAYVGILVIAR